MAFKWKGFISLDCAYGNIHFVMFSDLESVNLFDCSLFLSVSLYLSLLLLLMLPLQNAMNIHYLQNQMHHVTPCYVGFLMFEFNFLVPISPAIRPTFLYSSFAAPILYGACVCVCVLCTLAMPCPHSFACSTVASVAAAIQIMPLQFHQS